MDYESRFQPSSIAFTPALACRNNLSVRVGMMTEVQSLSVQQPKLVDYFCARCTKLSLLVTIDLC